MDEPTHLGYANVTGKKEGRRQNGDERETEEYRLEKRRGIRNEKPWRESTARGSVVQERMLSGSSTVETDSYSSI